MRSTFKLLYFVKRNAVKKNGNAPIIARITIDQVVAQFNIKLEINPAHWSVELGKASGRTAEAVHINSSTLPCVNGARRICNRRTGKERFFRQDSKGTDFDRVLQTAQRTVFAKG